jgi:DNA-binding NtrC family response regulator
VFHIHLPPLRERKEDMGALMDFLIGELNRKHSCKVSDISPGVHEALLRHSWPGNVRELRNVLERAVILAGEGTIELKNLPAMFQNGGTVPASVAVTVDAPATDSDQVRFSIGTTVEEAEKGLILRTLEHTRNNKTRAAEILGISLKTLHNKLKEYGSKEAGATA